MSRKVALSLLITTNPAVETLFLNPDTGGISVTLKKRDLPIP